MLRRARHRLATDDGLTLVEMLIAIFIVGFAVIAMTSTLITSFTALVRNETLVHATSVANQTLEDLQDLPWNSLALYASDVAETDFEGEDLVLLPDPPDPPGDRDPRVPDPEFEVVRENRTFDVEVYITWVPEGTVTNAFKRMVVIVTYEDRGNTRTMRSETIRTPTPDEEDLAGLDLHITQLEPVSVDDFFDLAIVPDGCYPTDPGTGDCGKFNSGIRVGVVATEPVATVSLYWEGRSGLQGPRAMAYFPERNRWETTISSGERFANGEAWFTAKTPNPDFDNTQPVSEDNPEYIEGRRRVTFLHPLSTARFDIDPGADVCVDEDGQLQETVTVAIDLIGADTNLLGSGLVLSWASVPDDPDDPQLTYPVATVVDTSLWGGTFEVTLAPDPDLPPLWDTAADDPPDQVELRIGPIERQVPGPGGDEDDFVDAETFTLNVVAAGGSC